MPRWLALLALLPLCAGSAAALTIQQRREATVEGDRVLLVDVAEVRGGPSKLALRLRALDLGPAPLPDLPRILTRKHLERRVRAADAEGRRLSWDGAEHTRVLRRAVVISGERMAAAAAALARKALPRHEGEFTVRIAETPPAAHLLPPMRGLRCHVLLPGEEALRGEVAVPVAICRRASVLATHAVVLEVTREPSRLSLRHGDSGEERRP